MATRRCDRSRRSGIDQDDLELGDPLGVAGDADGDDPVVTDLELDHTASRSSWSPDQRGQTVDDGQPRPLGAARQRPGHVRRTPHIAVGVLFLIVTALILAGGVKQLAEATALLLLTVFAVVNISLVVLKHRPGEPEGGFEVPTWVPITGAIVCVILIGSRIHGAFQSPDSSSHIAPLVAGGVIGLSLLLYRVLKPSTGVAAEDV